MIEDELLTLAHVKGQYQVADLLTKALGPQRITQLLDYLGCVTQVSEEDIPQKGNEIGIAGSNVGQKGTLQSLVVLSCLLSPARAQPTGRVGLEESAAWLVWVVVLLLSLISLVGAALIKKGRLERLRVSALASNPGSRDDSEQGELEGHEELEPWEKDEFPDRGPLSPQRQGAVQGVPSNGLESQSRLSASGPIPVARSTVGTPPPLRGSSLSKPKAPFRKAPPPVLVEHPRTPKAPPPLQERLITTPKAPPPVLERSQRVPESAIAYPKIPVKRLPLLPVARFHGPLASSSPKAAVPRPADESDAVVHTPPRQQSVELSPLLSYWELIQRAMRRELNREPTDEEVDEEIRQMGIRNARAALESSGSESNWSDTSPESHVSDQSLAPQVPTAAAGSSGFTYCPPEPTPVLRLVAPREGSSTREGVVWDAVRVDRGRLVPTTVVANERASGSSEAQQWYVDDVVCVAEQSENASSSEWANARKGEASAISESGAVMIGPEDELWLSSSRDGSEEGETQGVEAVSLDHQLASATLLLHQHTSFQVPATLEHLNEVQRAIYEELLAQWREG